MNAPPRLLRSLAMFATLASIAAMAAGQPTMLEPAKAAPQRSPASDCEDGIVYDDGVPNNAIGWINRETSSFVMRFDDVGVRSTVQQVCVCLTRTSPQGTSALDFDLVVYADDAAGEPGTLLGRIPVSAQSLPIGNTRSFYTYDVSANAISAPTSHVWIGVELPRAPTFETLHALCIDQDNAVRRPVYTSTDGGTSWTDVSQLQGFGDPDSLLVRAVVAPSRRLILPFYEVDTLTPDGQSTLFSVRNPNRDAIDVRYDYFTVDGELVFQEELSLGGEATRTVNLRNTTELPTDPDGFRRGYLVAEPVGSLELGLVGDFFQIDGGNDFATGERMIGDDDFCQVGEARFLDFGAGTDLRVLLREPQGGDPDLDPASFTVRVLDEAGNELGVREVHSGQPLSSYTDADFTTERFGTLVFDFAASGGGYVFASYSAEGRYSVGLEIACRDD